MLLLLGWLFAVPADAASTDLRSLAYDPKPGSLVPLQARFRDESGRAVRLSSLLGGPPTILALGYFHCPNLCGVVRADLYNALARAGLTAGPDYAFLAVSIDPAETSDDALAAKARDIDAFPLPGASAWRFLVGDRQDIEALANAVGFRDLYDEQRKQFAHPAGVVILAPNGAVSSYLLGLGYKGQDLRLALERAGAGVIAKRPSPILLLCFDYDPRTGRYTLAIMRVVQLTSLIFALALASALYVAFRRESRQP